MVETKIADGFGTGNKARVEPSGALHVIVHPHPPTNEDVPLQPFRQYFTNNGTASGSNDWAVDGSSVVKNFSIQAVATFDIYIKSISLVIGDGGSPALNKYGALNALTNGTQWCLSSQELGLYELHDGIKTNLEFIRIGVETAGIGTGTDAYLADVSGGGTEKSYLPTIDLSKTFGLLYGVRLRKGTKDKLIFTVRDDLTALTTHNAIGYGIRI